MKESLGEKKGKTNEEWFDEGCRVTIQEKDNMRKIILQKMTRISKETYREHRRANKYVEKGKERC